MMNWLILFVEGIITFISPCLLPMLPVYLLYFAGGEEKRKNGALYNALFFVLGFSVLFVAMGAFAGFIGGLLIQYKSWVNIVTGLVVIIFGLGYTGLFKLPMFKGGHIKLGGAGKNGAFSSFLFGIIFSIGWTPCVGAFLGSALLMASREGTALQGVLMLAVYSAGLGIPFVLGALLINKLKSTFDFIKKHYKIINTVSGILLITVGILMMTGYLDRLLVAVV